MHSTSLGRYKYPHSLSSYLSLLQLLSSYHLTERNAAMESKPPYGQPRGPYEYSQWLDQFQETITRDPSGTYAHPQPSLYPQGPGAASEYYAALPNTRGFPGIDEVPTPYTESENKPARPAAGLYTISEERQPSGPRYSQQAFDPNNPRQNPQGSNDDRGVLGALGGAGVGGYAGHQVQHGVVGTIVGAIAGSVLEDKMKKHERKKSRKERRDGSRGRRHHDHSSSSSSSRSSRSKSRKRHSRSSSSSSSSSSGSSKSRRRHRRHHH